MLQGSLVAAALAGFLALAAAVLPAMAGGPVETSVFAVQGVEVDVTSTDATSAKNQALMDVQVKAFFELVERLGSAELAEQLKEKMKPEEIAPFLRSLSIEKETSAPGRYIGTFVPIIIPLGDTDDTEALTTDDALNGDTVKLDAIRKRYDAASVLVAQAEPAEEGGLHVYIEGDTKLGRVNINKVYTPEPAEDGTTPPVETAATLAFQKVLYKAYQAEATRIAEEKAARSNTPQSLAVTVPFNSPREWNAIRSRILNAPNVSAVDLSSLDFEGANIRLVYTHSLEELQGNMQRVGLSLTQGGTGWVIRPM